MKNRIGEAWFRFWRTPASPRPLAFLRLGVTAVLLVQAICVAPRFFEIYAGDGILQGALRGQFGTSALPAIYELGRGLDRMGLSEATTLAVLAYLYLGALAALFLGYRTRAAAIMVWALHYLFAGGHITSYGIDSFANIALFYFCWMPMGATISIDAAAGRSRSAPSVEARVSLRLLQLHLSIAYFFCGFHKSLGMDWWNGEAIWGSVTMPLYAQWDMHWLARAPWIPVLAGWGTLVIETGYAIAMWVPRVRPYWVLAIASLHLGICFLMGLHLFALMMIVLTVGAFGISAEPAMGEIGLRSRALQFRGRAVRAARRAFQVSREEAMARENSSVRSLRRWE